MDPTAALQRAGLEPPLRLLLLAIAAIEPAD